MLIIYNSSCFQVATFLVYLSQMLRKEEKLYFLMRQWVSTTVEQSFLQLIIWYWYLGSSIGFQNDSNMDFGYDYRKCIGLKVKPRQGDAFLFYWLFTSGSIDLVCISLNILPELLHGVDILLLVGIHKMILSQLCNQ